eukprot:43064-Prorocentrum_minimum.AAC.2
MSSWLRTAYAKASTVASKAYETGGNVASSERVRNLTGSIANVGGRAFRGAVKGLQGRISGRVEVKDAVG